jgi:hypothetical protein
VIRAPRSQAGVPERGGIRRAYRRIHGKGQRTRSGRRWDVRKLMAADRLLAEGKDTAAVSGTI